MPRRLALDAAVDLVRPTDSLAIPLGPGQPGAFLHALGARERFDDLTVSGALLGDLYELFTRPGVRYRSGFFGPVERMLRDAGHDVAFVPADFRGFAPLLELTAPRMMATAATPPDAAGVMSLSLHAGGTVRELHRCGADPDRVLVVEVNPQLPRTFGLPEHPHALQVDEADVIVEGDRAPLTIADGEETPVDRAIAEHARGFVTDGCTLQTGIGGIPSTFARLLAEGPGGDYGVHSEMFTTGLMHLHHAGKVTNQKGVYDGFSVTTFAAGTTELYEWLHERDDVRFLPVEHVNAPAIIARNRRMVTINGAVAVDLYGQLMADTIQGVQFSGVGGHEDFVAAPGLELEDRSLVCLPSTATINGESISRIVTGFPAGAVVTTPRHQLDVVVTEHGA
ncbi:MAG TPA: acetyl-CoA hydrolase/transferase C-terminal domain-containing protein, partial [Acidimicrobiia bacterium]|nr:acetyl-CoA hydrolase/transferase C-terminal domain-containing protein [Acidimicrobiia bacterium]